MVCVLWAGDVRWGADRCEAGLHRHLVHASDHEQAEALLTRWHQDRIGKLPRELPRLNCLPQQTI